MMKEKMESGYTKLNEGMDSGFGLIAKKFDLLHYEISVRDKEIAVMNRKIAENSADKGKIGEKIRLFENKLDILYKLDKQKKGSWWDTYKHGIY
jgi:hypothetical protein